MELDSQAGSYQELCRAEFPLADPGAVQSRSGRLRPLGRGSVTASRCTTRTRAVSPRRTPSGTFSDRRTGSRTCSRHWVRCLATGWRSSCRNARKRPSRRSRFARWARWPSLCRRSWGRIRWNTAWAMPPPTWPSSMRRRSPEYSGCATAAALLRHVLGVGSAAGPGIRPWDEVLEHASARYTPTVTAAGDPAMILYRGGGTRGALMAHRMLFGKLSAFVCAHDFFPQPRDMLWSPGESAWAGGFWDALLPTWHFGMPLLAYNGRLDAAKVFALIEKYGIRNAVLWPTLLQRMMQQVAEPGAVYDLDLRTLASVGEPVDPALWHWARDKMGVAINGVFGPAGLPDLVGNWASRWPASPGAVGRAYPGHRVAVIDAQGNALPPGEVGEFAVFRQYHAEDDPLPMLGYWRDPEATAEAVVGDGWVRTGESATLDGEGNLFCQQPTDDTFASAGYSRRPVGDRDLSAHARRRCQLCRDRQCGRAGRHAAQGFRRPAAGRARDAGTGSRVAATCRPVFGALRNAESDRIHRGAAARRWRGGLAARLEHTRSVTDGMHSRWNEG